MKIVSRLFIALLGFVCSAALQAANLKVNLAPTQAVSAGAQWRVDGGTWRANGVTVSGLSNGSHSVECKTVTGWIAPATAAVTLSSGTTTLTKTYVQTASLKITLTPSSGQWRVDGGAWRASATTVTNLAPGNHTVDYASVSGYATPATETVALAAAQNATLTRTYTQLAQVSVTLTPSTGQWRVDGGALQASGATVANLTPGSHTLTYSALAGYTSPPTETVTLASGQSLPLSRSYVALARLSITLTPSTAQWRVDGGAWQSSGAIVANLAIGAHTVNYASLAGYTAPPTESVTLSSGQLLSLNRSYVQLAKLTMNLTPAGQWRIDGGAWQNSGVEVTGLNAGIHTIDYSDVGGIYDPLPPETISLALQDNVTLARTYPFKPSSLQVNLTPGTGTWRAYQNEYSSGWQQSGAIITGLRYSNYAIEYGAVANYDPLPTENVALSPAQSLTISRSYTERASFNVSLTPSYAQWRLDGGAWLSTSTTLNNLSLGAHTVEFSSVEGFITPPSETVSLVSGSNPTLTRSYTQLASFNVSLTPSYAQWRLDGGAWQFTSATLNNLPLGTHLVEFSDIAGYITPASETVTLVSGSNPTLTRAYTQLASFNVSLTPSYAQWRLDGGAWQFTSATLNNLPLGVHTVEFSPYEGYIMPPAETVTLVSGSNPTLTRSYTQLASFNVSLTPSYAQWRLDGGAWQFTSATLNNLPLGDHTVEFSPYEGYITPPAETVTLVSGSNPTLMRSYTPLASASLTVTLTPATAQWRLDQGAWQSSGATVGSLAGGSHLIEFSDAAGYNAPAAQYVTLSAGAAESYSFTYAAPSLVYEVVKTFPDAGANSSIIAGSDGVFYGFSNTEGNSSVGLLFKINADGTGYAVLKNFGGTSVGHAPTSLVEGSDGVLYGTTNLGGPVNAGTVFKINKDGTGYTPIRTFAVAAEGLNPNSLIEGSNGVLYGTTTSGGSSGFGVVFRLNRDGSVYGVLRGFATNDGKAAVGLIEGPDGALYGTATNGGASGFGTVFKLNKSGSNFSVLKTFIGGNDGANPRGPLLAGTDGLLYGTTSAGGTANRGTLFRLNADGAGYAVIKNFAGNASESGAPSAQLKEDVTGILYGTATSSGPGSRGSVFMINKDGSGFAIVKTFTGGASDGGLFAFQNAPISVNNGVIHGVARLGGTGARGVMFRVNSDGANFSVLKNFGAPTGSMLMTSVTEGNDGVLYGTTYTGGSTGYGTIFRVNKDGTGHVVLRNFISSGSGNFAQSVIAASDGALYGIIASDLVRLNRDGTGFAVVRSFVVGTSYPVGVIEGSDGVLYGATGGDGTSGFGTVFKMNKDGSGYAIIHNFTGGPSDGRYPYSPVIEGSDGTLYGTTVSGGSAGLGTVFSLRKDGTGYAVLKHFTGGSADGATPWGGVIHGSDNFIYGTTTAGGANNQGTIFKLATDGSGYLVLRSFTMSTPAEQNLTYAGVIEKNGALYGVTYFGGTLSGGTVFTLKTDGTDYTTLINFGAGDADGTVPAASLYPASDGFFYGTTARGGSGSTIFRLRFE